MSFWLRGEATGGENGEQASCRVEVFGCRFSESLRVEGGKLRKTEHVSGERVLILQ